MTQKCNKECEVFSRVVGYYRPVSRWNEGKQEEFKERKMFAITGDRINKLGKGEPTDG